MKIAVLGAGFTGLTAAYRLAQQGHQVTVFEKESAPGGLASGFKNKGWQWPLERFYHHFFASDQEAINLIKELDLGQKLLFKKPITAIYYPSILISQYPNIPVSIYPFDSPLALLKFPHLSLIDRLRTGIVLAYLKTTSSYKSLEKITAEKWLKRTMGENVFKVLWEPLLVSKFGDYANQVSAAWFWARIKKRTRSLGYLEGGFQTLVDRLVEKIEEKSGQVLLGKEVRKIERNNWKFDICNLTFDIVISTLPTPVFLKIAPPLPSDYSRSLSQIPRLWAQTLVLELKRQFLEKVYWLNINDASFPFLAVVEHTNFIDKSHYAGRHLLYIGNYLPDNHPYLKKKPPELLKIFTPYLKKINSQFDNLTIRNLYLFSAPYAQPVITVGCKPLTLQTPIKNLYLANLDCVYPWDRGTNYAIELGEKVAEIADENF